MSRHQPNDLTRFVAGLAADGYMADPAWKQAFSAVRRHVFLPSFFVSLSDGPWQAIDATHRDYWRLVYADTTLTTQLDGSIEPDPSGGPVTGTGTSSSTQPGLMAVVLDALQLRGEEDVLEIGTGTGYNAALLSHHLGGQHVTTVEVDPAIAEHARQHLTAAGYQPKTVIGDGEHGWPQQAPYDRLIATVSVPAIPAAWLGQVRDGALIVTSLWRDLGGGPLVQLEVNTGTAQGFLVPGPGSFMPVRSASRVPIALSTAIEQDSGTSTASVPSSVLHDPDARLWQALRVCHITCLGVTPDGGHEQLWLFAQDGSWAMVDDTTAQVQQHGPRWLWAEIETTHRQWADAGHPRHDRLGMSVAPIREHRFWLDTPDATQWNTQPHRPLTARPVLRQMASSKSAGTPTRRSQTLPEYP